MKGKNKIDLIYPEKSYQIIGSAFKVFNALGFGHKEIYYQRALLKELEDMGLRCKREQRVAIKYKNYIIGTYIPDFLVNDIIVIELKVRPKIGYIHINQVLNYLKATDKQLGIVIYFTPEGVKYRRIINIKN